MNEKEFYIQAGKRMKELRERKRISQAELSHKTGIDQSLISKFENSGKKISAYRLKQLLEAMDYTLADLVHEDTKKNFNPPILSMALA